MEVKLGEIGSIRNGMVKDKIISLLNEVTREGADIQGLINKLENSDFFTAPASTKFHCNYEGGLAEHSLNVFEALDKLCDQYAPTISRESRIIVSLLHDLDKMNKYEKFYYNVKDYRVDGKFSDSVGKFNWKEESGFKMKDAEDRFVFADHGKNSEYEIGYFIPLTLEESAAVINHMSDAIEEYRPYDMSAIFNRYLLATLLHAADFLATFMTERTSHVKSK